MTNLQVNQELRNQRCETPEVDRIVEQEMDLLQLRYEIDVNLYDENDEEKAVVTFFKVWKRLKRFVEEEFYWQDEEGRIVKPEITDVDDQTDFRYELYNLIEEIEQPVLNSNNYAEAIEYFTELTELFAWEEESADTYYADIGVVLNSMKRYEECDKFYDDWLRKEPRQPECIERYGFCLLQRRDLEKARQLMEQYVEDKLDCSPDNEMVFVRGEEIYHELGDEEKEAEYAYKIEECYEEFERWSRGLGRILHAQEPIRKGKKIYPNDPCPCGSGKKYKKCCGKNK